ncbi:MAG: DUF4198 domain-containing protein [Chitinophagaceae bacterium]|nr:DUF4198 domain-containing protein [Chitinophagaceae bacterium]
MNFRSVAILAIILLLSAALFSHHYILVPDKFIYQKGDSLTVHLMVGEPFDFEFERELQHQMTPHFMLYSKMDSANLLPLTADSIKPILRTIVNFEGLALIEMQRTASTIEQKRGAFTKYLEEEKITTISFDSTKWKKDVVKENYSRCIKSLITSGKPGNENLYSKVVGQRLEILLMSNPYQMEPNQKLVVKVLWEGKPLASQWITSAVKNTDGSVKEISALTDRKGMAAFEVAFNTVYYLHTIYMLKLKENAAADYESIWASYSFQTAAK